MIPDHECLHRDLPVSDKARALFEAFGRFKRSRWMAKDNAAGLSPSEAFTLLTLAAMSVKPGPGLKPAEMAVALRVSRPTMTQTLNVLENRGLVSRAMDGRDRRAVRVTLSAEGLAMARTIKEGFAATFEGLLAHLGPADSADLARLLNKTAAYFESIAPKAKRKKENPC